MTKIIIIISILLPSFIQQGFEQHISFDGKMNNSGFLSAEFCPDSNYIISLSYQKPAALINLQSKKQIVKYRAGKDFPKEAVLSPDGSKLFTLGGHFQDTLFIWDAATGKPLARFWYHTSFNLPQFSPDGKKLLTLGFMDSTVMVRDASNGALLYKLSHNSQITEAKFSIGGKYIATCSWDRSAKLWNADNGKEL